MTKNERSVPWVSLVTLHPQIAYSGGKLPTSADEERLHQMAHAQCFIAKSIKTEVTVKVGMAKQSEKCQQRCQQTLLVESKMKLKKVGRSYP
jgi:hypothetical protein